MDLNRLLLLTLGVSLASAATTTSWTTNFPAATTTTLTPFTTDTTTADTTADTTTADTTTDTTTADTTTDTDTTTANTTTDTTTDTNTANTTTGTNTAETTHAETTTDTTANITPDTTTDTTPANITTHTTTAETTTDTTPADSTTDTSTANSTTDTTPAETTIVDTFPTTSPSITTDTPPANTTTTETTTANTTTIDNTTPANTTAFDTTTASTTPADTTTDTTPANITTDTTPAETTTAETITTITTPADSTTDTTTANTTTDTTPAETTIVVTFPTTSPSITTDTPPANITTDTTPAETTTAETITTITTPADSTTDTTTANTTTDTTPAETTIVVTFPTTSPSITTDTPPANTTTNETTTANTTTIDTSTTADTTATDTTTADTTTIDIAPTNTTTTDTTPAKSSRITLFTVPAMSTTTHTTTTTAPTTTPTTTTTSTTTTVPTPPASTALECENEGKLQGHVCICPDQWTGKTCSTENFCRKEKLDRFTFPQTAVGWFAYSEETCEEGTSAAGRSEASIRCSLESGVATFELPPQLLQCDQTLNNIQQNLTDPADLEALASSTQILTSKPEELTAENVTAAVQIADTLLRFPNASQSVRVAAVATVSQLLTPDALDEDDEENSSTVSLTQTLDQLSVNLSLSGNVSQSQLVQPNLVVQSALVPTAGSQGVQFTSLTGSTGSFVPERVRLNTNTSTVEVESGFIADALILVEFSADATRDPQEPQDLPLGFVLYQNDRFFRSRVYRRRQASVRVLSASVGSAERRVVPRRVELRFRPTMVGGASLFDFSCVFWDFTANDWSTAGCWKGSASDGVLSCFCNHTTNFAALWSFRKNYKYAEALSIISIVGLTFSILGLIVTIAFHLRENWFRKSSGSQVNRKVSLLCACGSLLAFIITFLSGVENKIHQSDSQADTQINAVLPSDEHVDRDAGACTAVAALLHFFLLSTFMWNAVFGTELVLLVRSLRRSLPSHWTAGSLVVGWGVPAVIVAVTLGVTYRVENPLRYRQEEFCWLAALDTEQRFDFARPMFWSFLLPVGLILVYNLVLLVLVSMTTCRSDPLLSSNSSLTLRKKFLASLSVAVLLGLTWTLGYLVIVPGGDANLVFSIVFCVCSTTQGLQIFVLFTARTPGFRAIMSRSTKVLTDSVLIPLSYTHYNLMKILKKPTSSESYREWSSSGTTTNSSSSSS